MADTAKSKPVHKARLGPWQLAGWENEYEDKEGQQRTFHTFTLERNYRDKDGNWQKTNQYRDGDLGDAIALLQNAQQWLVKVETP